MSMASTCQPWRARWLARFLERWRDGLGELAELARRADPAHLIVRYEQLVTDPAAEARRLGDWLGVTLDADAADRATRAFRPSHSTTASPGASVGRWRTQMDAGLRRHFRGALGPQLEAHGYESG
jgi:hypothetical protein